MIQNVIMVMVARTQPRCAHRRCIHLPHTSHLTHVSFLDGQRGMSNTFMGDGTSEELANNSQWKNFRILLTCCPMMAGLIQNRG